MIRRSKYVNTEIKYIIYYIYILFINIHNIYIIYTYNKQNSNKNIIYYIKHKIIVNESYKSNKYFY